MLKTKTKTTAKPKCINCLEERKKQIVQENMPMN